MRLIVERRISVKLDVVRSVAKDFEAQKGGIRGMRHPSLAHRDNPLGACNCRELTNKRHNIMRQMTRDAGATVICFFHFFHRLDQDVRLVVSQCW